MGGIALGRNEKTPSFFWPGFEFKNYNWHPVLTGGQKTFLYQDFFRTLSLIWKTLPLPPQKSFYFNWQKGCSWTHGCRFSFSSPFSVKFSLKTFHFLVLGGFYGIFLLAGHAQMIVRRCCHYTSSRVLQSQGIGSIVGSVRYFAHISLDGDCCLPKTHLSLKCLRNRALTYFFRFRFPAGVCTILVI